MEVNHCDYHIFKMKMEVNCYDHCIVGFILPFQCCTSCRPSLSSVMHHQNRLSFFNPVLFLNFSSFNTNFTFVSLPSVDDAILSQTMHDSWRIVESIKMAKFVTTICGHVGLQGMLFLQSEK